MKGECNGCELKRELTKYDMSHRGPGVDKWFCDSCANVLGVHELQWDYQGKLLLQVNSKLDLLLRRNKK